MQSQNTNQVKKRGPADSYSRSSFSYLLVDFENERYAQRLRQELNKAIVPKKFDYNDIPTKHIKAPYLRASSERRDLSAMEKGRLISDALKHNEYAQKIMRYWWQVQEDGSYSIDLIQKRGLYNATDVDVNLVDASKVGRARLADAGVNLIGKSYVLVLDYENIRTMREIYDYQDAVARERAKRMSKTFEPVERKRNGFKGRLTAYLYKLNYSDTIQGYLDASFINESKFDLTKFNNIFNHIRRPYKFITSEALDIDGTQLNKGQPLAPLIQKSKEQLFAEMVHSSILKVVRILEGRVEAFRVKTSVTSINPIKAKVGTKEGLRHERRFFVWEYVANRREQIVARKVGTIRARRVANNLYDKLGNTQETEFYQIGGRTISEGMTIQERKDAGIGVGLGAGTLGVHLQLDINLGQAVNLPLKQTKFYGELFVTANEYKDVKVIERSTMEPDGKYTETTLSAGLLKEYPLGRGNFRFGWKLGISMQNISWTADKNHPNYDLVEGGEGISALGIAWGINFGVNLFTPSINLIASLGGRNHGGASYSSGKEGEESVKLENSLSEIFPDKKSILMDLSLRFSF